MSFTHDQLTHLEHRLLEERSSAEALVNRIVEERAGGTEFAQSGDLSLMPFHSADRGTDSSDEDLSLTNAARASAELVEIDAALIRLREKPKEFGRCEQTGVNIAFERLNLIPWARTCE